MTSTRPDLSGERGFSMFLAIMAMLLTSMFIAAGFAAANGDLPVSGVSKNRKTTYAAAEAGLNFYLNHLQQDNDYWTKCDSVPAPNAGELNPVNQQWDGGGADPRRWRSIPESPAQYTIEILHTAAFTACDPNPAKQASVIDLASGTFKIRATGRPSATNPQRRSIVATFRRKGFLNFIYFTDYENVDPQALADDSDRTYAQNNCANKYRSARAGKSCNEIQFVSGDEIKGPLHTNDDSLLVCGSPAFGRDDHVDVVEVSGPDPGWVKNGTCSASPVVNPSSNKITSAKQMPMPTSNDQLADVAEAGGTVYSGKTIVNLKINGYMDVTNYDAAGTATLQTNVPWPVNGVLYVKNNGACTGEYPIEATYTGVGDLRQRLRQRYLHLVADDRGRQRRDHPSHAGREAVQQVVEREPRTR